MSNNNYELEVVSRDSFGKGNSRRARTNGMIPAIIYSKGQGGRAVLVKSNEWAVLSNHDLSIITLVDGGKKTAVLVKEVQYNYLKGYVVHIDFLEVDLNAEIHSEVAVHVHGIAPGTAHGGVLELELHVLNVCCKASDLPEQIVVDVAKLEVGDMILVKDLVLPQGVKALNDPEATVVHVAHVKEEAEPEVAVAAEPEVIAKEAKDAEADAKAKNEKK